MRTRITAGLGAVALAGLVVLAGGPDRAAGQDKKADPKFLYGHDVRVRNGGTKDFDEKTPKVGYEVYHNTDLNLIVAVTPSGHIAALPAGQIGAEKTCKWVTAHDMKVRKMGEPEFTQKTKVFGVELFRDAALNRLVYFSETGAVAFAPIPATLTADKGPKWHHALELKVRGPEQPSFESAKGFGLEVFKDENTGGLVYVTESGALATAAAPATAPDKEKVASPKTLYGLVPRVRAKDEANFTEKTKRIGVEVYEDTNAGVTVYASQSGSVAVVPAGAKDLAAKGLTWKGAMTLKARKPGEADFAKAETFSIEVVQDNRSGNLLLVCETGSIAVVPKP